jgi:uncharacterized protein (DUF2336 family)
LHHDKIYGERNIKLFGLNTKFVVCVSVMMRVIQFLQWVKQAAPEARAQATAELAQAYLYNQLSPDDYEPALAALTVMLDDQAVIVRQALAQVLAPHESAPLHIILALLEDVPEVACPLIAASPLLQETTLLALIDLQQQEIWRAIAQRESFSEHVLTRLFEVVDCALAKELLSDATLPFTPMMLAVLANRFPELHEILLDFAELPLETRYHIAIERGKSVQHFLSPERASKLLRHENERVALQLSSMASTQTALLAMIEAAHNLTPALLLRALYCGNFVFLEEALAHLSGLQPAKIAGLLQEKRAQGIAALLYKAELPDVMLASFRAGLVAWNAGAGGVRPMRSIVLSLPVITHALQNLTGAGEWAGVSLLQQFSMEAAREEARLFAEQIETQEMMPYAYVQQDSHPLLKPLTFLETYLEEQALDTTPLAQNVDADEEDWTLDVPAAMNDDAPSLLMLYQQERAA